MRLTAYTRNIEASVLRRSMGRFLLGIAQMLAAGIAITVLISSGVNRTSLLAATIASALTMLSVLIFRK
jgi:hypothetical protein